MEGYVIGVDIGTTSTKAVLLGPGSRVIAESGRSEYKTNYIGVSGAEQDPNDWWAASASSIRSVLDKSGISARDIAAVGVSSQAPCVVCVDGTGSPVRPAPLWMDRRSGKQCEERMDKQDEVRRVTGNNLDPYYGAPKVAYLLENDPETMKNVRALLTANGYVTQRLSGVQCMDKGHVGLMQLGELKEVRWSSEMADLWNIPEEWLPQINEPTDIIGEVTDEASASTGLATGTPVVAGAVDGAAASLEAGVASDGDVCEMSGQSTVLNGAVSYESLERATGKLGVFDYPTPGVVLLFGAMVSTGGIVTWFRDEFGDREVNAAEILKSNPFDLLDQLPGNSTAGSNGLLMLPYFLGERAPIWDTEARGAFVGLSMNSTRADVFRAIYEGAAFGLNHNLEELRKHGLNPPVLRIVGGGSLSRPWNQIKADITGLPVEVPTETIGAPVGTALCSAVGAGLEDDLAEAVRRRYKARDQIQPDPDNHKLYARYYEVYKELYPALKKTFKELAALRESA